MVFYVAKEGVWQVEAGSTSGTPVVQVPDLAPGKKVKVTCNFVARTMSDDNGEGFFYSIVSGNDYVVPVTPASNIFQGCDGWQSATLVALFEVTGTESARGDFSVSFKKGDMDGKGTLLNFKLLAEVF